MVVGVSEGPAPVGITGVVADAVALAAAAAPKVPAGGVDFPSCKYVSKQLVLLTSQ
jgi:hypothetical protein